MTDPFKDATQFWQMCPHHYTNEQLYQAFIQRFLTDYPVHARETQEERAEWFKKMVMEGKK